MVEYSSAMIANGRANWSRECWGMATKIRKLNACPQRGLEVPGEMLSYKAEIIFLVNYPCLV